MTHNNSNSHSKKPELSPQLTRKSRLAPQAPLAVEEELSPAELAEIWAQRAYALAEEPPAETTGQTFELLICGLEGEYYGLEVNHVREIYPLEQITPVPRTPAFVVGVFSARGRLISVVDLRAFFGLPSIVPSQESKLVVVATDDLEIGLLANEVTDVVTIFKDDLEPALSIQTGSRAEFTQGIAPGMLVVLNLKALLSDKRLIIHEEIL